MNKPSYKKVTLITGLPGSGKTNLANSMEEPNIAIIHLDEIKYISTTYMDDGFVAEGLITGDKFLQILDKHDKHIDNSTKIEIIEFESTQEERKKCLINDALRRRIKPANKTINNFKIEIPKADILELYPNTKFTLKKVYEASDFEKWLIINVKNFSRNTPEETATKSYYYGLKQAEPSGYYMWGESWSGGGTRWGINREEEWHEPGEPGILSNTALDDLLEHIAPSITFLQYKKVSAECNSVCEFIDSDYYSSTKRFQYIVDLKKFYDSLVKLNLIEPKELEIDLDWFSQI